MKPPTVFLGEMTNAEVEDFLAHDSTVIVPVGSTEQHGPHAPLLTDVLIPNEIARRIAPRIGAVVAAPVNYGLSYPHVGFTGVVHLRIPTFMALVEDLCTSLATIGFTRIVFLNGHYDNTYAIAYACANAAERMPAGVVAFPVNYWDGLTPEEAAEFFDPTNGLHANRGETSAVLAIDPGLVDMERANVEFPPFPEVTSPAPVHTAFFFSSPGSVHRATVSGTWGDAREATADFGERYLRVAAEATIRILDDIERTRAAMPGEGTGEHQDARRGPGPRRRTASGVAQEPRHGGAPVGRAGTPRQRSGDPTTRGAAAAARAARPGTPAQPGASDPRRSGTPPVRGGRPAAPAPSASPDGASRGRGRSGPASDTSR